MADSLNPKHGPLCSPWCPGPTSHTASPPLPASTSPPSHCQSHESRPVTNRNTMTAPSFHSLRNRYATAWKRFLSSSHNFAVLSSVFPQSPSPSPSPDVLYVLDSSFNPPTLAHLRIATSALQGKPNLPGRLLLLLATQNADKPVKPASFEDRLIMMELFAHDLLSQQQQMQFPQIDIAVTRKPYFVDKAAEIDLSGVYPSSVEQVHLTGYDTLVRIFNPKYYPPEHTLQPLVPFLSQHRLQVTMRPSEELGGQEEQRRFLLDLAQGGRASEGGRPEWAERIQLVEGKRPQDQSVSSTRAREAIQQQNMGFLDGLVPTRVREFLLQETPYAEA